VRTVELLPDGELDRVVRDAWRLLDDAGLSSQVAHRHESNRPHITVAVVDDWDPDTPTLLTRALTRLPVPLHVDGLRTFGQRRLALVVPLALEPELISVHEAVHAILDADAWGVEERHVPGRWAPHLTLGRGMDRAQEAAARRLLETMTWPNGYATGARTYDTESRTVEMIT
jgi:2'-5' RNA ligase